MGLASSQRDKVSVKLLYTSDEQLEIKIKTQILLTIPSKIFRGKANKICARYERN